MGVCKLTTKLGEKRKMTNRKESIKQTIKKDYDQTRIKFAMIAGQ